MNDIVVGVDKSATARRAAVAAAELAAAYGANLHVVMCADRKGAVSVGVGSDRFHSDWVAEADQFLDDLGRELPHTEITRSVGEGDPATALCDEAARLGARTIVVGNRRVQGVSRVLGSIASDVLKKAPCDVLIVNTTGEGAAG